jgi:maleylpyruvate isomerase
VTGTSPPAVTASLAWAADGAAHLRGLMTRLGDDAFRAPSLLPGWSRAHVLSHVARNADAMINLLRWARTGTVTPAYASAEARVADIEKGAVRTPAEIRQDVIASSDRLAAAVRDLPEAAWAALVTNVQGRVMRASAVPWVRAREMWVHAVDLDAGAAFADMPGPMVNALLVDACEGMSRKPGCPVLRLVDGNHAWDVGEDGTGPAVVVTGTAPELAAWLVGRSKGKPLRADGSRKLPVLPPWL